MPRQSRHCESGLLEQISTLYCYKVKASACSGNQLYQPIPYLIYLKDNMDGGSYFSRSALVFLKAEIKNYHSDFHHSRDKAHTYKVNYISTTRQVASPFSNLSKPSLI